MAGQDGRWAARDLDQTTMLGGDPAFGILLLNVSILGVFPLPCEPGKLGEPLGFRIARSRADDSPDVFFVVDQRPD